jgi:hypothetical protein
VTEIERLKLRQDELVRVLRNLVTAVKPVSASKNPFWLNNEELTRLDRCVLDARAVMLWLADDTQGEMADERRPDLFAML